MCKIYNFFVHCCYDTMIREGGGLCKVAYRIKYVPRVLTAELYFGVIFFCTTHKRMSETLRSGFSETKEKV